MDTTPASGRITSAADPRVAAFQPEALLRRLEAKVRAALPTLRLLLEKLQG
jgi:hypothetical protein